MNDLEALARVTNNNAQAVDDDRLDRILSLDWCEHDDGEVTPAGSPGDDVMNLAKVTKTLAQRNELRDVINRHGVANYVKIAKQGQEAFSDFALTRAVEQIVLDVTDGNEKGSYGLYDKYRPIRHIEIVDSNGKVQNAVVVTANIATKNAARQVRREAINRGYSVSWDADGRCKDGRSNFRLLIASPGTHPDDFVPYALRS